MSITISLAKAEFEKAVCHWGGISSVLLRCPRVHAGVPDAPELHLPVLRAHIYAGLPTRGRDGEMSECAFDLKSHDFGVKMTAVEISRSPAARNCLAKAARTRYSRSGERCVGAACEIDYATG